MESRKLEVVPQDFLLGFKSCVSTSRCLFAERLVHKVKKKERRKQKEEGKNDANLKTSPLFFPTSSFKEKDSPCIAMRCFINVPLRTLLPVLITPI